MEQPLGGAAVLIVLMQVADELEVDGKSNKLEWGHEEAPRDQQLLYLLDAMGQGRDLELTCQALALYHGDRYQGQDQAITAIEQVYVHEAERYARALAEALSKIIAVELPRWRHLSSE